MSAKETEVDVDVESESFSFSPKVKEKLGRSKECEVSQTSVQTLVRLFPNTKLSVLQLVLQRCGQDLLKAIEYFTCTERTPESGVSLPGASAFRPPQTKRFQDPFTSDITDLSKVYFN